jgi:hypothetical protein
MNMNKFASFKSNLKDKYDQAKKDIEGKIKEMDDETNGDISARQIPASAAAS